MEEDDLRLRTSSRSVSVVPETPEEEEYFDAQDAGDDIEEEDVEGDVELEVEGREADEDEKLIELDGMVDTVNVGQLSVPVIVDMDEDGELETEVDGQQLLMAPSITRASSTSSNSLKASTRSTGKRKLGGTSSQGLSPASTPGPPEDSTTVSTHPLLLPTSIAGFYSTRNHPMNKAAFRYTACGPSPGGTERFPMYRLIQSPPVDLVRFSWEDRSSFIHVSLDALAITTEKGFRSARANVPLREGAWYYEVLIERGAGDRSGPGRGEAYGPHVRLGIGRRESHLNAPVGFDGYSYGIRDKTGDKIHLSQPRAYGEAFTTGDVIGVYLFLPPRSHAPTNSFTRTWTSDPHDPSRIVRKRVPIRYKGQLYFESMEYSPAKEMEDLAYSTIDPAGFAKAAMEAEEKKKKRNAAPPPGRKKAPPPPIAPPQRHLPTLEGSKLAFFKNGECQGTAFDNLFDWLPLRQHSKEANLSTSRISSSTAILLARENHHDDGTLGYYPFVSVFGGGIARLNPGPQFRYPPLEDIESLVSSTSKRSITKEVNSEPRPARSEARWRPLSERYEEYYSEIQSYDKIDEQNALDNFKRNTDLHDPIFDAFTASIGPSEAANVPGEKVLVPVHPKKKTTLRRELVLASKVESRRSSHPGSASPLHHPGPEAGSLPVLLSAPEPSLQMERITILSHDSHFLPEVDVPMPSDVILTPTNLEGAEGMAERPYQVEQFVKMELD